MRLRPGAPVLLREPDHVQVGLATTFSVKGLPAEERAFLASLEGRRVGFSRVERERHRDLIETLDRHGLLESVAPAIEYPGLVRIRGVDPITTWLSLGLVLAGVSRLSVLDSRRPQPGGRIPGFPRVGGTAALLRLLRDVRPAVWMAAPDERARVEVLRAHGATDLALARILTSMDVPHLDIVTDEDGVEVGPLIVPGVTPCETCLGIERTERDPWWPRIALQLGDPLRVAGLVVPTTAALLAAGLALREVVALLDGETPSSVRWRVPFDSTVPEPRLCRPHPDCGCGAPPVGAPSVGASSASPVTEAPPGGTHSPGDA